MGWNMVSILSCSDSYGTSVASSFLTEAANQALSVVGNQVYAPGVTPADITPALNSLKLKPARIIILCGTIVEGIGILRKAKELGMVGSDWVWIMPDAGASLYTVLKPTIPADLSVADGIFYVFPKEDGGNDLYRNFMANWNAAHPHVAPGAYTMLFMDCLSAVARGLLKVRISFLIFRFRLTSHTRNHFFIRISIRCRANEKKKFGSMLQLSSVHGAQNVASRNYTANITDFLTYFEGISGPVNYDSRGNRIA
jgi:ABC-type branched-subunit amino acid transport system substrate-binding protein